MLRKSWLLAWAFEQPLHAPWGRRWCETGWGAPGLAKLLVNAMPVPGALFLGLDKGDGDLFEGQGKLAQHGVAEDFGSDGGAVGYIEYPRCARTPVVRSRAAK